MKHEREMVRWAKSPDGMKVWNRSLKQDWVLNGSPTWNKDLFYVVDDEFAEFKMAFIDNKKIQAKILWSDSCPKDWDREWTDFDTNDAGNINGSHNGTKVIYRLKPEIVFKYQFAYKTKDMMRWKMSSDYYESHADFHAKFIESYAHELKAVQIDQTKVEEEV